MKMHPKHYKEIEQKIAQYLADHPAIFNNYKTRNIPRGKMVKDINKRFRWDMLFASVPSIWICSTLYPYLNDEHIDTALRKILSDWIIED